MIAVYTENHTKAINTPRVSANCRISYVLLKKVVGLHIISIRLQGLRSTLREMCVTTVCRNLEVYK
jgi:hypothetical protein